MGREVWTRYCGDAFAGKDQSKPDDEEWRNLRRNAAKSKTGCDILKTPQHLGFGPPPERFGFARSLAGQQMRMNSKGQHCSRDDKTFLRQPA
jgi:hypothetical protein